MITIYLYDWFLGLDVGASGCVCVCVSFVCAHWVA